MKSSTIPWRIVTPALAGLAAVAVLLAGWEGYSWWSTSRATSNTIDARDSALRAAMELAVTLQTVEPNHPEESMRSWQQASTGALLQKLQSDANTYLAELRKTPSTSQATVVDAALTDVDAAAGTATVITALDVSQAALVNGVAGAPTTRQLRVKLALVRTDQGWKVASSGLITA